MTMTSDNDTEMTRDSGFDCYAASHAGGLRITVAASMQLAIFHAGSSVPLANKAVVTPLHPGERTSEPGELDDMAIGIENAVRYY